MAEMAAKDKDFLVLCFESRFEKSAVEPAFNFSKIDS